MKTLKDYILEYEIHHDGNGNYRDDEGNEWTSKSGSAHRSSFGRRHTITSDHPHSVHINGKKWKTFGSHSHASNVAKKIKGATVHKEEVEVTEETDKQFAQRMKKQAEQPPTKGMSQKEKVAKGWAHPDTLKKEDNDMCNVRGQTPCNCTHIEEGLSQTLRKVIPGYAKREIDKKMDAGKFGKTDADKDANFQRYKKIQDKIKKKSVAEEVELDEAVDPSEVASNPKMYNSDTVKKAYYHKNASEADKQSLARHLDRHHGNKEWRNSVKEESEQLDEISDKTLMSYAQKVHDDSQKHDKDPTKRSAEKRNKSVMGFSRALNKLESRPHKEETELGDAAHATTMKHRILVTYSDPHHTASHMRKEKVQKHVLVPSSHKGESVYKAEAEELAKKHIKKQGYKVHEVEHVGLVTKKVHEEVEQIDELTSITLQSYKDKAKESAEQLSAQGKHAKANKRWMGHMKATGKQIEKTTANIKKALNKEELSDPVRNAKQNKDVATGKKPMPKRKLLGFKNQSC